MLIHKAIEYIGITMVSSGITLFGIHKANFLNTIKAQQEGLLSLLYAIENGVKFGSREKKKIYSSFENAALEKCGFLPALRNGEDEKLSIDRYLIDSNNDKKKILYDFFKSYGKLSSSVAQLTDCRYAIAEFEKLVKDSSPKLSSTATLYKRLGLICGIISIIILI